MLFKMFSTRLNSPKRRGVYGQAFLGFFSRFQKVKQSWRALAGLYALFLAVLCFSLSCARETPAENRSVASAEEQAPEDGRRQTMVRTGPEPFWFELAAGGPRLIPSPRHAALEPFVPWKLSRYIVAFLADENRLTAAVNQEGFLVFDFPKEGEIAFCYYPAPSWAGYSVSSVFRFERHPAALLVRDGIFSDPAPPPPDPALWRFDGTAVKSFEPPGILSPEDGWETVDVLWGGDGAWYCRKVSREPETGKADVYLRAADLAGSGEKSSGGAFLQAARPKNPAETPSPAILAAALEAAGTLAGKPCMFNTVSPEFEAPRVFETGMNNAITELVSASAYYRSGTALALLPDGRGVFRGKSRSGDFALPPLPEGYAYTSVCLAGENDGKCTIVVSWEEQKDWNIGAAGFGMLEIRF
jgi:hypothetical protein